MKKFLVVMLALAMVFGLATTALADEPIATFSDLGDQPFEAVAAIQKLAILGVLGGDDGLGGAYRPNDTLTRAEFTKIVCFLADIADERAESDTSQGKFADVTAANWFNGYVNAAVAAQYFQGTSPTTFSPQANITIGELVTVALRVVGYDDNLPGDWPANYFNKARAVGILDDVDGNASDVATRAEAAIIAEAVLDLNMVVYIGDNDYAYGTLVGQGDADKDGYAEQSYISNEEDQQEKRNILDLAFGGESYDVIFAFAPDMMDEIAAWNVDDYEDMQLSVDGYYYDAGVAANNTLTLDMLGDTEMDDYYYIASENGYGFADLAGMHAEVVVLGDEIAFIEVLSSYELADEIYENGNRINVDGSDVRISDIVTDDSALTYIVAASNNANATNLDIFDVTNSHVDVSIDLDASTDDDTFAGKVYLDADGDIYAVKNYEIYDDEDYGIFEAIDVDEFDYIAETGALAEEVNTEDNDNIFYLDNVMVDAEDIEEGDVVYYAGDNGAHVYLAYSPMEGELTEQSLNDGTLTIDGVEYPGYEPAATDSNILYSDDGGEAYADFNIKADTVDSESFGEITYVPAYYFYNVAVVTTSEAGVELYGVVEDMGYTNLLGNTTEFNDITVINAEGEEVTYDLDGDVADALEILYAANAAGALAAINADQDSLDVINGGAQFADAAELAMAFQVSDSSSVAPLEGGDIIKFELNSSDEIIEIQFAHVMDVDYFGTNAVGAINLDVTANSSSNRISWTVDNTASASPAVPAEGAYFDYLADDAIIFNVALDSSDYDGVDVITTESLVADDFEAQQIVVVDTNSAGDVTCLYYIGDSAARNIGIVTDARISGGDDVAEFDESGEYVVTDSAFEENEFVVYGMSGTDVTVEAVLVEAGSVLAGAAAALATVDADYELIDNNIDGADAFDNDRLSLENGDVIDITDATYIYDLVERAELAGRDLNDADYAGDRVAIVLDGDAQALYVIVYGDAVVVPPVVYSPTLVYNDATDEVTINWNGTAPAWAATATYEWVVSDATGFVTPVPAAGVNILTLDVEGIAAGETVGLTITRPAGTIDTVATITAITPIPTHAVIASAAITNTAPGAAIGGVTALVNVAHNAGATVADGGSFNVTADIVTDGAGAAASSASRVQVTVTWDDGTTDTFYAAIADTTAEGTTITVPVTGVDQEITAIAVTVVAP